MHIEIDLNGTRQVITAQHLREIAAKGIIGPETMVRIDGTDVPAKKIQGIVFGKRRRTGGVVQAPPTAPANSLPLDFSIEQRQTTWGENGVQLPVAQPASMSSTQAAFSNVSSPVDVTASQEISGGLQHQPRASSKQGFKLKPALWWIIAVSSLIMGIMSIQLFDVYEPTDDEPLIISLFLFAVVPVILVFR